MANKRSTRYTFCNMSGDFDKKCIFAYYCGMCVLLYNILLFIPNKHAIMP